jgi:hypothetical protein
MALYATPERDEESGRQYDGVNIRLCALRNNTAERQRSYATSPQQEGNKVPQHIPVTRGYNILDLLFIQQLT